MLSYVISGPVKSRALKGDWVETLERMAIALRRLDSKNQLILSTYEFETASINGVEIIYNSDPGNDNYLSQEKIRKGGVGNTSRMLQTTLDGLMRSECQWSIKSRIELIPSFKDVDSHLDNIMILIGTLSNMTAPQAAFLLKSFGGSVLTSHGTMLAFPDTFQIMRTNDIQKLWSDAQSIFKEEEIKAMNSSFPLKIEQFMGQAFIGLCDSTIDSRFSSRYYFNRKIFRREIEIMKNENIRKIFEEFINDPKYKKHFSSNNDQWLDNLEWINNYIINNKKRPSSANEDETIRFYGLWINTQMRNYQHKTQIMSDENIRKQWESFVEENKELFLTDQEQWIKNHNWVKNYIDNNNKRPTKQNTDEAIRYYGKWLSHQVTAFNNSEHLMKIPEINIIFKEFINDSKYKNYFI
jgi:hypothetical protein